MGLLIQVTGGETCANMFGDQKGVCVFGTRAHRNLRKIAGIGRQNRVETRSEQSHLGNSGKLGAETLSAVNTRPLDFVSNGFLCKTSVECRHVISRPSDAAVGRFKTRSLADDFVGNVAYFRPRRQKWCNVAGWMSRNKRARHPRIPASSLNVRLESQHRQHRLQARQTAMKYLSVEVAGTLLGLWRWEKRDPDSGKCESSF